MGGGQKTWLLRVIYSILIRLFVKLSLEYILLLRCDDTVFNLTQEPRVPDPALTQLLRWWICGKMPDSCTFFITITTLLQTTF